MKGIAISSAQRFPGVDDLPTIGETLPGFEIDGWLVVVAPAGTPKEIIARLNQEIDQFLRQRDIQQRLSGLGLAITGANTSATTEEFIRREQVQWRSIAQELDLKPE